MDAINDIDTIVRRVVATLSAIGDKLTRFATLLLGGTVVVCVGSFLLGLVALGSGIRAVWIVLGFVFAAIAIGAAAVNRWGVGRIRRDVPAIAGEVRAMIAEGREQSTLIVREFDRQLHNGRDDGGIGETIGGSAILVSRRVFGLRELAGQGVGSAARLTAAVHAITRLPLLTFVAFGISVVFAFLAAIFLLGLALS
jgi:hypothetical protein